LADDKGASKNESNNGDMKNRIAYFEQKSWGLRIKFPDGIVHSIPGGTMTRCIKQFKKEYPGMEVKSI